MKTVYGFNNRKRSHGVISSVNVIGNDGIKALSEALEINQTVAFLNISGLFTQYEKLSDKQTPYLELKWKDNEIDAEGAKALGKMLKVNATLRTLWLDSLKLMYHENRERERNKGKTPGREQATRSGTVGLRH